MPLGWVREINLMTQSAFPLGILHQEKNLIRRVYPTFSYAFFIIYIAAIIHPLLCYVDGVLCRY